MRYMVVERFKANSAKAIYERARDRGRMLPDGLAYVDGWVSAKLDACFQVMECNDKSLFEEWIRSWSDLIEFEVVEVISSAEASARALDLDDASPS